MLTCITTVTFGIACTESLPWHEVGMNPTDAGLAHKDGWPQMGRTPSRNMESPAKNIPFTFDPGKLLRDGSVDMSTTKNVLWAARLGSQTFGNPTVSNGRVFVGTNNEGRGDPRFKGDHSLLKCLDSATGRTIWTLTVPKLGTGKVGDWEYLGLCSSPTVVGDRVYILTNRCEVMCLDVHGMADGNQGFLDEGRYMARGGPYDPALHVTPVEVKSTDANILWRYDMIRELGVSPHNVTYGSILVVGDILYCSTSNGVTYDHTEIPSPKAPALIALNRKIAERPGATPGEILVGEEGSGLSRRILHSLWTSPSWGEVAGRSALLFGGPDGFCYAFDPNPVKDADGFGVLPEIWRYDCNPPDYRFRNGDTSKPIKYASLGEGPSEVFSSPTFYKGRVYATIGQDPEHRAGPGNLSCIDADTGRKAWDLRIGRSMSTCSIVEDRVYVADFGGWLYCIDANDGRLLWKYDTQAQVWGSTLVADDKVYLGNQDGILTLFSTTMMRKLVAELGAPLEVELIEDAFAVRKDGIIVRKIVGDDIVQYVREVKFPDSIPGSPIVAGGVLYVATMRHLYAIKSGAE